LLEVEGTHNAAAEHKSHGKFRAFVIKRVFRNKYI